MNFTYSEKSIPNPQKEVMDTLPLEEVLAREVNFLVKFPNHLSRCYLMILKNKKKKNMISIQKKKKMKQKRGCPNYLDTEKGY